MFGYFCWNSTSIASRILPSGPVRPFQKASVTLPLGTAMSPAAAGLLSAGLLAGAAWVGAGGAAGAAGLLSAGFDSAGLAGAASFAGALVVAPPPHAWRSPPAATVVATTPN